MAESIHVFSLPLGPAQPGLNDRQITMRRNKALSIVRATMPSTQYLSNCILKERIVSDQGLLWLAFDLVETTQMQLLARGPQRGRKGLASALNGLYGELARLREDVEATVIRVGELAEFSSRLHILGGGELTSAIEDLSERDWELWRLIHARKGRRVSIDFPTGSVGITMPLFPTHISEKFPRKIRFRVRSPSRVKAEIDFLGKTDEFTDTCGVECPKTIDLLRPMGKVRSERDAWFLLYVAQFRNVVLEATVRMALNLSDFSASHLELVELVKTPELIDEAAALGQFLTGERINVG